MHLRQSSSGAVGNKTAYHKCSSARKRAVMVTSGRPSYSFDGWRSAQAPGPLRDASASVPTAWAHVPRNPPVVAPAAAAAQQRRQLAAGTGVQQGWPAMKALDHVPPPHGASRQGRQAAPSTAFSASALLPWRPALLAVSTSWWGLEHKGGGGARHVGAGCMLWHTYGCSGLYTGMLHRTGTALQTSLSMATW